MIEAILNVLAPGQVLSSIIAGILAGLYLEFFHPHVGVVAPRKRALLSGWYFASAGIVLYAARIAFAIAANSDDRSPTGPGSPLDVGRVIGGLLLWLLFSVMLILGVYLGSIIRSRRSGGK